MALRYASRRKSNTSVRDDIEKIYNLSDYKRSCQLIDVPPPRRRSLAASEVEEDDDGGLFNCECYKKLKRKPWFGPLYKTILFLIHISIVFTALALGASFLGNIEDPPPSDDATTSSGGSIKNATQNLTAKVASNVEQFWSDLKNEIGVEIPVNKRDEFMEIILKRGIEHAAEEKEKSELELRKNRDFIFWKWLYFMSVACTTIGYGDVSPKTDNGRFFYMIFSLFGIPLVVSVLTACGGIIKAINKRFFKFLNRCCFKEKPVISESLMTTISIFILFIGYVAIGCLLCAGLNNLTLFESIYFWIVTFSTVGFGDITTPLTVQVDWAIPLMAYRIFGLAMLAGVIDSLIEYIDLRKEAVQMLSEKRMASLKHHSTRRGNHHPGEKKSRPELPDHDRVKPETLSDIIGDETIFSTLPRDYTNRRSFHDIKTFDARVHEPVFGDGEEKVRRQRRDTDTASTDDSGDYYESDESGESYSYA
eukprot:TCONS_00008633-protein